MEREVAIVTDTIACLPREETERYHIREIPLQVIFGNRVYVDKVNLTADNFYSMLIHAKHLPTTAAPSPEHFLSAFRDLSREGKNIVCITLFRKLSSTYDSAKIAADMAREILPDITIKVLDSRTVAAAEGLVVLAAARAAALGKTLFEVLDAAQKVMSGVHFFAVIDTLKYLAKGGRVPSLVAWAGSLLDIKPILSLKDGELIPVTQKRTSLHAVCKMIEMTEKAVVKGLPLHMAIMHAAEREKAEELKRQISSLFNCAELFVTEFTPVMGTHTGPGLLGVSFYCGD